MMADREEEIFSFLRRARRRFVLRELLLAMMISAVVDLVFTLLSWKLATTFSLPLPALALGPPLFALLILMTLRRNRRARLAERADRRFGLKDRLVTFLAFRGSTAVDPEFRAAQAGESARAVGTVALALRVPVPRLFWIAPALFAGMLYVEFFPYIREWVPGFPGLQILPPTGSGAPGRRTRTAADPAGTSLQQAAKTGAAAPEGKGRDEPARRAATPGDKSPEKPAADPWQRENAPGSEGAGEQDGAAADRVDSAKIPAPAKLFSETVGKGLTPVVEPDFSGSAPAKSREGSQSRGKVSFSLVPAGGAREGAGGQGVKGGAGGAGAMEITVDFDALPQEYRVVVRRYFDNLVKLLEGGTGGT